MTCHIASMITALPYPTAPRAEVSNEIDICNFLLRHLHLNRTYQQLNLKPENPRALRHLLSEYPQHDKTKRPLSERVIISALQAKVANPDYSDFMHTMGQYLPGLRTITLPRGTIPNIPATSPHSTPLPQSRSLTLPRINRVTPNVVPLNAVVHPLATRLPLKKGEGNAARRPENAMTAPHPEQ